MDAAEPGALGKSIQLKVMETQKNKQGIDWKSDQWKDFLVQFLDLKQVVKKIPVRGGDEISIPLTTAFVSCSRAEYSGSPRAFTISRQLENAFLNRLKRAGAFSSGEWLDIGGTRHYGEWLKISPPRYHVFNLPNTPETTVEGDFDDADTMDFSKLYDGLISLNCLYMSRNPQKALTNIFRLLKPGGLALLEFSSHHYWYLSEDGEHWSTFNPWTVTNLIQPFMTDFLIVPVGNLFQACVDYYARKKQARILSIDLLLRNAGHFMGRYDLEPRTAMHYFLIGKKNA